jgi:uncharacterized membrane protein
MSGSYNFLLHVIAFGFLSFIFLGGYFLDRKLRGEKEWAMKLYLAGMMRKLGIFSPIVSAVLLITGIGNIHNRLMGVELSWYEEGWLVAKVILFAIMLVNGTFLGPMMSRRRAGLIKAMVEKTGTEETEKGIAALNRQITLFYAVQGILLLAILYLSTFGPGKHPGVI